MPVGRRQKEKEQSIEAPALPLAESEIKDLSVPAPEAPAPEAPVTEVAPEVPPNEIPLEKNVQSTELPKTESTPEIVKEPEVNETSSHDNVQPVEQIGQSQEAEIKPDIINKEAEVVKEDGLDKIKEEKTEEESKKSEAVKEEIEIPKEPEKEIKEETQTPETVEKTHIEPVPEIHAEAKSDLVLEGEATGAIILKSADYFINGLSRINDIIKMQLRPAAQDSYAKTEALVYSSLFDSPPFLNLTSNSVFWTLIQQKLTPQALLSYLTDIEKVTTLSSNMSKTVSTLFQEVRGIKFVLSDGGYFYLDGQFHNIWSTPSMPSSFSTTFFKAKNYVKRYFEEDENLVFFMAPGYDAPTDEFYDFVSAFGRSEIKKISSLSLLDNDLDELEFVKIEPKKRNFIFGLWPWQFVQYRKIKSIKEFKPFFFEPLKEKYYIADVVIELLKSDTEFVSFRGAAIKASLNEKTRLVILSNIPAENATSEELCNIYLNHWPNMEEGFQDYSRKIEVFTYSGSSESFSSTNNLWFDKEPPSDIKAFFGNYLKALDSCARFFFLPSSYEKVDFPTMQARFYDLKVMLQKESNHLLVTFLPPAQYGFLKDLEYACRRLNECEIISPQGMRFWFLI